jgi:hypothetical protein
VTPQQSKLPSAVFLGFAVAPAGAPAEARAALQHLLEADATLPRPETILPVGAGLVFCFDYPTRTLEFVRLLGARLRGGDWPLPPLQMGIHIATMSRSPDAPEATLSGGSIDGATRAARLAAPNQAIATSQFQTLVVQLLKINQGHFIHLGRRTASDGKTVDAYEIPPFALAPGKTRSAGAGALPPDLVNEAERLLANEIGPLAKLLVRQTATEKIDRSAFVQALAASIPDGSRRSAFVTALNAFSGNG